MENFFCVKDQNLMDDLISQYSGIQRDVDFAKRAVNSICQINKDSPRIYNLQRDSDKLSKVFEKYGHAIELFPEAQPHEIRRAKKLRDLTQIALEVIKQEQLAVAVLFTLGVDFIFYKFYQFQLTSLESKLKELKKELESIKKKLKNLKITAVVNTSISAIELMLGPLSLTISTTKFISQRIFEAKLKTITPSNTIIAGVGDFAEHIAKIEKIGKAKTAFKLAGKSAPLLGFYFEIQDVLKEKRNIKVLEKKMENAKKDYERFLRQTSGNRKTINRTSEVISGIKHHIDLIKNSEATRKARELESKKIGFNWY